MKKYFLLFLVGFCSCVEDSERSESWIQSWGQDEDHEHIDRPCYGKDMNCIRKFFSEHSHCKVSHGPAPDPLYMKKSTLPLANANITFILNDIEVKGINNAKITEFYVNKKSGNLVLAVEIRKLTIYSPHTMLKYQRKAKEPIVLTDSIIVTYGLVTMTATIPNYKHLELSSAEVFTYVDDSNPPYAIGPNAMKSLDPVVIKSFNKFVNHIPDNAKEAYIFMGPMFMSQLIQSNICDFGLKVESS